MTMGEGLLTVLNAEERVGVSTEQGRVNAGNAMAIRSVPVVASAQRARRVWVANVASTGV